MTTGRGDMRLIPGAYEMRPPGPGSVARAALETRRLVPATVPWLLPEPTHQTRWIGRAGAALGSLLVVMALVLLLGLIPRALDYVLASIR